MSGGPSLGSGPLPERVRRFREEYDSFRAAVVQEPRGSDIIVGALLCEPFDPTCDLAVIFFNNVGVLGMCGHGTIGLLVTLAHAGRIGPGSYRVETPVGVVQAVLHADCSTVTVRNVPSYRHRAGVSVSVPGVGNVVGDVAWGGNWFYLIREHGQRLELGNVEALTEFAWEVRQALQADGVAGADGDLIDHIEMFASSTAAGVHSKNFVLCPGKAYDRSPCGTGTSAKLACLYADGLIQEGEIWRQESIVGSVFEGSVAIVNGRVIPSITGSAHVTAEAQLIFDS
ncbi:MAG: proline racemase family protein, partial [Rhodospirillales bacterium]|nr:proline racemase family protein [Acetobacter sp.]